jgi:hypothetical protein
VCIPRFSFCVFPATCSAGGHHLTKDFDLVFILNAAILPGKRRDGRGLSGSGRSSATVKFRRKRHQGSECLPR